MESILLVIHVIVALLIVGLIMLQQGKGAEMGASFGAGSSQTVFGASGTGNFFSRMTAIFVAVFFLTSFVLAMLAQNRVSVDEIPIPVAEEVSEEVLQNGDLPVLEETSVDDAEIPEIPAAVEEVSEPVVESLDEAVESVNEKVESAAKEEK